ncbi:MAG: hypothetical protein J6C35_03780 [Bacteroidales bacterium]|nr:hypothetical protein [Bacteroidales bacterium]
MTEGLRSIEMTEGLRSVEMTNEQRTSSVIRNKILRSAQNDNRGIAQNDIHTPRQRRALF